MFLHKGIYVDLETFDAVLQILSTHVQNSRGTGNVSSACAQGFADGLPLNFLHLLIEGL